MFLTSPTRSWTSKVMSRDIDCFSLSMCLFCDVMILQLSSFWTFASSVIVKRATALSVQACLEVLRLWQKRERTRQIHSFNHKMFSHSSLCWCLYSSTFPHFQWRLCEIKCLLCSQRRGSPWQVQILLSCFLQETNVVVFRIRTWPFSAFARWK